MRTGKILVYLYILIPALLVLALSFGACGKNAGEDELVFTEQPDRSAPVTGAESPTAESPLRSNVELSGQEQPRRKLLILPFVNATKSTDFDILISGLPQLIQRVFAEDRFVVAESIAKDSYEEFAALHGLGSNEDASMELARMYHNSHNADLILCGRIMMTEKNLLIEPRLFAFTGDEGTEEDLPPMEIRPDNFLKSFNPLTERIRDYLIDLK
jgi:hypothetical protein